MTSKTYGPGSLALISRAWLRVIALTVAPGLLLFALGGCSDTKSSTGVGTPAVIISSLAGNDNADISFANYQGRSIAVGFRMHGRSYKLQSLALKLRTLEAPIPEDFIVRLYDNDPYNNPGHVLLTFLTPSIPAGMNPPQPVIFPPPSPFVLEANTTYWIVAYYTGPDIPGWTCGSPSLTPTGVATHVGAKFDLNALPGPPTSNSSSIGEYEIVGES